MSRQAAKRLFSSLARQAEHSCIATSSTSKIGLAGRTTIQSLGGAGAATVVSSLAGPGGPCE